jgi:hypothetical protein
MLCPAGLAAVLAPEPEVQISEVLTDFTGPTDGELTGIRWVSPAEADDLMGGAIYEPARDHLRRAFAG